jgi:Spy/CpxP family protein refolding chaperone
MRLTLFKEMSMRHTRVLLAAAIALAFAVSMAGPLTSADAGQGRHRADIGKSHGMYSRLQERLGLTDDQVKAIQDIHARQGESRKQLGQALRQAQTDLRQLALNGGADDAVQAASAEVEKLLGQMVQLRVKALQEMAPHLTPEQREKLAQLGPGAYMGRRGHFQRGS